MDMSLNSINMINMIKTQYLNNYIVDITEDKNGYIWVSTINGLSRIDTDTDEIKNYYSDKNNGNLSR